VVGSRRGTQKSSSFQTWHLIVPLARVASLTYPKKLLNSCLLNVGVIGKDGRTSAITAALRKEGAVVECLSEWKGAVSDPRNEVLLRTAQFKPDFVIVGPEEPLAEGIVDDLNRTGVPCIGPTRKLAQLEASKSFTRHLLEEYDIPGNPQYRVFTSIEGIAPFIESLDGYVVKPDGLTGGKGVQLSE